MEAELQRIKEGRIWARVHEEVGKRERAEERGRKLQAQVDAQQKELSARSQRVAADKQELITLRSRCKSLQKKLAGYQGKPSCTFFKVKSLITEDNEELNPEKQRLRNEITELKGITEPGKYFHDDSFTPAVDLAIAEAITTVHISRKQVLFARFFCIIHSAEPQPQGAAQSCAVGGKLTHVKKQLHLCIPGKKSAQYYTSDGVEPLQTKYLAQLLSGRDADGNLKATSLDLTITQSKTLVAQADAFNESRCPRRLSVCAMLASRKTWSCAFDLQN
uniref:Uncharacterized protein n=1 Tax=Chrysotila carterae TaxID=13221 RepID=A0A7S4F3A5_CHRCT|mmetsp:Transcript_9095/g.19856  ORF Transcript_9095/g.19856 Transcript_9095/m.19856 type:complete len:276 (+) Transcript_9095:324-1151(+)|eukprot:6177155-Pleurochrysis_carterae.AAC.1